MPGYSLWLIPSPHSKVYRAIEALITEDVPRHFPSLTPPMFSPHITLTSEIPPDIADPQAWLDNFNFPFADKIKVKFVKLDVEEPFFRKCNIAVEKEGVAELAVECRARAVDGDEIKAREWVDKVYRPHCSLLYADTNIPDQLRTIIEKTVADAGISVNGDGGLGGWEGGIVWLVPTTRPIAEWKPIAQRRLATDVKKAYATAGS